jgi:tetratricopeptide (TPR) repeat protein
VALSCQNRYDHAVEAYKQALEIDPNNESYKQNLSIAENKLAEAQAAMGGNAQVGVIRVLLEHTGVVICRIRWVPASREWAVSAAWAVSSTTPR